MKEKIPPTLPQVVELLFDEDSARALGAMRLLLACFLADGSALVIDARVLSTVTKPGTQLNFRVQETGELAVSLDQGGLGNAA